MSRVISLVFNGRLKLLSRFSVIGILNTVVDFVVFTIFNSLLGINYTLSQIAGYSFGIINSFIFNRSWTFENKNTGKKMLKEFSRFVVINLISLTVTIIFMKLLISNFGVNVYMSKVIVTFIAQVTNFLGYKLWVFN